MDKHARFGDRVGVIFNNPRVNNLPPRYYVRGHLLHGERERVRESFDR